MPSAGANHRTETLTEGYIKALQGWDIYLTPDVKHKRRWDLTEDEWEEEPVPEGVAHAQRYHAQGAERLVFHCTEIAFTPGPHRLDTPYKRVGASLVSKQTKHEEYIEVRSTFRSHHRSRIHLNRQRRGRCYCLVHQALHFAAGAPGVPGEALQVPSVGGGLGAEV